MSQEPTAPPLKGEHQIERLRQVQAELESALAQYTALYDLAPVSYLKLGREGNIRQANLTAARLLGTERAALPGRALETYVAAESRPGFAALLAKVFAGVTPEPTEVRLANSGRAPLTVLVRAWVSPDAAECQVEMTDITERKRVEEDLRQKAALLEIAQDAICVQNLDGRIEYWNAAAERLYGWSRQEAVGVQADDLLFSRLSRELLQARADNLTHGSWSGELVQAAKDGRMIPAFCRFSLVRDAEGQPRSILILSTDLSEKKKLEEQFLRAQRLECIGALASGVAHDLNNVFAPIVMASELLADQPLEPSTRHLVEMVSQSALRGSGIVKQLLTFGRGASGTPAEFHLEQVLKEVQRLGRETFPRNLQFTVQMEADLWSVIGDPTQIHQVLLNLCLNARDAMPLGGPLLVQAGNFRADEVFCGMHPEAQPGAYVQIQVADAGTGIPEALLDKIFDPFFTTKPVGQGTGLGLPTVLTIVKAHRGFLQLESKPGQGTRVRVFLPATEQGTAAPGTAPAAPPVSGHGELVLVVDDEEAICLATQHCLAQHGYTLLTARDGVEAIAQFIQHQAQLRVVITDMMMPGMDGAPFIRAIRKINPQVAIVAMSGILDQRAAAEEAGGPGLRFLLKPFRGDELVRVVREVLDQRPGDAQGGRLPAPASEALNP